MDLHTSGWKTVLSGWVDMISPFWPQIAATISISLAVVVTVHVTQHKRDSRAAAAWTGLVWLVPLLGAILYLLLGVNRIRRRARQLTGGIIDAADGWRVAAEAQPEPKHLQVLSRLVGSLTHLPLTAGNAITPMDAPGALQAMIARIDAATESVYLATYIFGNDAAGKPLSDALARAVTRGVRVRVLIDGVGSLYSLPPVIYRLRRQGVRVERFLHSLAPWRMPYMNLRNHRKFMVVDRQWGFTGGMNIRAGYIQSPPRITDLHVAVEGPVVGQLLRSFAADWYFTCGELLETSYCGAARVGDVQARGISAGPDADFDKRRLTLLASIGSAEHRIRIVTPYFVPDLTLLATLQLAMLKGVQVQVVVPARNNLRLVHWASMHALRWLVDEGAELHLSAAPFDHSKVMSVDQHWVMVGSGNWDARSLRLNFEFDLECYCEALAGQLDRWIDRRIEQGRHMTSADFQQMAPWRRVRNALAHMMEPYL
ncbi:cardiolipin synthase [Alcanivorax hongdengensis A-11-3]|uniref:Cardiolipin synthase n=1 Tax=Alcanivorax hongdengensis A-11-3 TaxID=1177179 RepID=L0W9A9_9GAMM|nr:phospholipase D-like domain-containing protein [Alcanivorax hongdengensis]EKF73569.1 cardiolipin synthase [Alcanivorax hongdengensis A-11-3]